MARLATSHTHKTEAREPILFTRTSDAKQKVRPQNVRAEVLALLLQVIKRNFMRLFVLRSETSEKGTNKVLGEFQYQQ